MFRCLKTPSAHSSGQMQFGCHQQAYFWTSVACMSIIHAFDNYVSKIIFIFPPFHLCFNSSRLHYQHGEDTMQDSLALHLSHVTSWNDICEIMFRKEKPCDRVREKSGRNRGLISSINTVLAVGVNGKAMHFGRQSTWQRGQRKTARVLKSRRIIREDKYLKVSYKDNMKLTHFPALLVRPHVFKKPGSRKEISCSYFQ